MDTIGVDYSLVRLDYIVCVICGQESQVYKTRFQKKQSFLYSFILHIILILSVLKCGPASLQELLTVAAYDIFPRGPGGE